MLQWNELHPYSAIHVVRIAGPLEGARLRTCINTTLEMRGLSRLNLDVRHGTYQYEGGPSDCDLQTINDSPDTFGALVAEMQRQLNLPFIHTDAFRPFRFLVAPSGDSFFLGLVYFHAVADAGSVVLLLKEIVDRYLEKHASMSSAVPELYPDGRAHLLGRHPMVVARRLLGLPAQIRRLRQSHRAGYRDAGDMTNGFTCFVVSPEELRPLVAAAKSWEVTVNDIFMALLMKSLSPRAAARQRSRQRRKISLGCIVNLRKDLAVDSRRTFGLFLGSFTVSHEVPDEMSLRELAGDVARQTSLIKRHKLYLGSPLELGLARLALKFFSPARRKTFYPKNYPLWGGVTNMNLNSLWEQDGGPPPLDYFRAVSTGPVTPLVLSVTTVGDRANIGLSFRTTVFSAADMETLERHFKEHLKETRSDV